MPKIPAPHTDYYPANLSALLVGLLMLALNLPVASVLVAMGNYLESLQHGSQVVLAMVLGAMIAFDMGGPVNKAAFFFGAAMIEQQNPPSWGLRAAAICTLPLGAWPGNVAESQTLERGTARVGLGYGWDGGDWDY
ncbi:MAG: hypothetical protein U1F83_03200 [Verrucomicrobiota bacterium]